MFDVLCALSIYRLLQQDGLSKEASLRFTSLWVLNPLVIHISTRGSCDSIECFLVFLTLLCLREQSYVRAAVVYGVAVHFRIYPIIYALALVLYCYRSSGSVRICVRFAVVSACTFSLLFVVFYALYGSEFVECCYLHHLRRIRRDGFLYRAGAFLLFSHLQGSAVGTRAKAAAHLCAADR